MLLPRASPRQRAANVGQTIVFVWSAHGARRAPQSTAIREYLPSLDAPMCADEPVESWRDPGESSSADFHLLPSGPSAIEAQGLALTLRTLGDPRQTGEIAHFSMPPPASCCFTIRGAMRVSTRQAICWSRGVSRAGPGPFASAGGDPLTRHCRAAVGETDWPGFSLGSTTS